MQEIFRISQKKSQRKYFLDRIGADVNGIVETIFGLPYDYPYPTFFEFIIHVYKDENNDNIKFVLEHGGIITERVRVSCIGEPYYSLLCGEELYTIRVNLIHS